MDLSNDMVSGPMMTKLKNIFIKSVFMALAGACFIVALDLIFALFAPKSYLSIVRDKFFDQFTLYLVDGVLAYHICFLIFMLGGLCGRLCTGAICSAFMLIYLTSWLTFIFVGEFLGIEGIRFVVHNIKDIIWMMNQISRVYILALAAVLLSPLAAYIFIKKIKNKFNWYLEAKPSKYQFYAAIIIVVIAGTVLFVLFPKLSTNQIFNLKFRVSPQATLFFDKQFEHIPASYDSSRQYLNVRWNKIISWSEYRHLQTQEPKAIPVIVMVVESLRSDVLKDNSVMPNVFALIQDGILMKPYTSSTQTDSAWPALLSSQYPLRSEHHFYYPHNLRFPYATIYDVLKQAGFATGLFSAQNERWGGMYNFLNTETLDVFFSADSLQQGGYIAKEDVGFSKFAMNLGLSGKLDDAQVVDEALQWARQLKTSKFFIAFNFQRPHFPYTWPESFQTPFSHCPTQPWIYNRQMISLVKNRYFNALRYTDEQIGRFIQFLKKQGLYDQSIIIVLGDHGEAFYEHGTAIHGNQIFNETALTSMVIKGSYEQLELITQNNPELIDMAPTILQMLGLPVHPAFQGHSWLDPNPSKKPVFTLVNAPFAKQESIVEDNWKLIKDYRNNRLMLFDLDKDPGERNNVLHLNKDLGNELLFKLLFWHKTQVEYYNNASLKDKYYPPQFSSH